MGWWTTVGLNTTRKGKGTSQYTNQKKGGKF
jgi:hypothetical protein